MINALTASYVQPAAPVPKPPPASEPSKLKLKIKVGGDRSQQTGPPPANVQQALQIPQVNFVPQSFLVVHFFSNGGIGMVACHTRAQVPRGLTCHNAASVWQLCAYVPQLVNQLGDF